MKTLVFFWATLMASSFAQDYEVDTLLLNGPVDNRINVVFLGDGYQAHEMDKFVEWVSEAWDSMFVNWNGLPYYQDYEKMFNLFAIKTPSTSSGVDHISYGVSKSTVYNCGFGGNWTTGSCSRSRINNVTQEYFPDYDVRIMVFNDDWGLRATGGDPIYIPHGEYIHVIKHELGHNIGKLGDTYVESGRTGTCREWPNVTDETRREYIKWNLWIDNDTPVPTNSLYADKVGLFVGANYLDRNCYRPKYRCLMHDYQGWDRGNMSAFCEVCREQMILNSYQWVNPIDSIRPDNSKELNFEFDETKAFTVFPALKNFKYNQVIWELDGKEIEDIHSNSLFLDSIEEGSHQLKVTLRDTTPYVISDLELLEETKSWDFTVEEEVVKVEMDRLLETKFNSGINTLKVRVRGVKNVRIQFYNTSGKSMGSSLLQTLQSGWNAIPLDEKLASGMYQVFLEDLDNLDSKPRIINILIL